MVNNASPLMVETTTIRKASTNKAHIVAIQHLTKTFDVHFATRRGTQPKTAGPYRRYKVANLTKLYFFPHLRNRNQT